MGRIFKRFRFEASHSLTEHPGGCKRNHGHSYQAKVFIRGRIRKPLQHAEKHMDGMVYDLHIFDYVEAFCDRFDHHNINDIVGEWYESTAENVALTILAFTDILCKRETDSQLTADKVILNETPRSGVVVDNVDMQRIIERQQNPNDEALTVENLSGLNDFIDEVIDEVDSNE